MSNPLFKPGYPTECQDKQCRGALCFYGDKVHCESCGALQDKHPIHADVEAAKATPKRKEAGDVCPIPLEATHEDRLAALERKVAHLEARLASMPTRKGA